MVVIPLITSTIIPILGRRPPKDSERLQRHVGKQHPRKNTLNSQCCDAVEGHQGRPETELLVTHLAADLVSVDRIRKPWIRAALWFSLGLPGLFLVATLEGLVVDIQLVGRDARTAIELAAIAGTALTAAAAALASTIPGTTRAWRGIIVLPFAIWMAYTVQTSVVDWQHFGFESLKLRFDNRCLFPMVVLSLTPMAAMLTMLRRGAPLRPTATLIMGTLAVAAFANLGLRLVHGADVSFMPLIYNFVVVALIVMISAWRRWNLLSWPNERF